MFSYRIRWNYVFLSRGLFPKRKTLSIPFGSATPTHLLPFVLSKREQCFHTPDKRNSKQKTPIRELKEKRRKTTHRPPLNLSTLGISSRAVARTLGNKLLDNNRKKGIKMKRTIYCR